ncbi:MAG TPA: hypothetical protein PL131_12940 [Methylotenera sp.]|nr:hypothetical protein [Methylotenera sp.]HPH06770.1 hypothetical protein [Methylotenera sp.]HPM49865.1 hypothetical protein [Methylotenera sp.]
MANSKTKKDELIPPPPASDVADDIRDFLGRKGISAWVIPWQDFYEVVERVRIRNDFRTELETELSKRSILISYGQAVVMIGKDYASHDLLHKWD